MINLGLTQRVEIDPKHGERRDCLDQRWAMLAQALNVCPIPLFNSPQLPLAHLNLDAILFTGGNSIAETDPDNPQSTPERDTFETHALTWALEHHLPVIGVCHGMQVMNHFFGGQLRRVEKHVACKHPIAPCENSPFSARDVNSYHNYGIMPEDLAHELIPLATHADGSIEAFTHPKHRLLAMMWHPEREAPFEEADLTLLKEWLT